MIFETCFFDEVTKTKVSNMCLFFALFTVGRPVRLRTGSGAVYYLKRAYNYFIFSLCFSVMCIVMALCTRTKRAQTRRALDCLCLWIPAILRVSGCNRGTSARLAAGCTLLTYQSTRKHGGIQQDLGIYCTSFWTCMRTAGLRSWWNWRRRNQPHYISIQRLKAVEVCKVPGVQLPF